MTMNLLQNITPLSLEFPDDESDKQVFIEAYLCEQCSSAPRHARVYWVNGHLVRQVVQLECRGYMYKEPNILEAQSTSAVIARYPMGTFTRDQREQILEMASEIDIHEATTKRMFPKDLPRAWTRKLLKTMQYEGLLPLTDFLAILDFVLPPEHA